MNVKIKNAFPPISEAQLIAFEKELGIKLPADYRAFLLKHNGGMPEPNALDVKIDDFVVQDGVTCFSAITEDRVFSFSYFLDVYEGRIPKNLFPIADGLSVDLICLSVSGDDYGKVYFWDHNWEVTDGEPDYSNVHWIADSFTEFLDKLYED